MRILQISSAVNYGGGERHFVDLARGLVVRGHEVYAALRPSNEWQERLDMIQPENILHVSIRNSFGMFSAKRIARFAVANDIDVIHAHVARDYLAAGIAARNAGRSKLVLTRHVMFPMKSFYRFALTNVDAAIAVSPAVRNTLEDVFPPRKVHVIANGLSIDQESVAERGCLRSEFREFHSIPDDALVVGSLGELKVLKGQRDLVLAANEVLKTIPNAYFVIAGRDNSLDKRFRRELKRLVKVLGHENRFLWLDWLDDTRPFYAASDLVVSASHSESFGLSMLEAMTMHTPVIATETDGAIEIIADERALVPVKEPVALADKIIEILRDREKRERLAETQFKFACDRFDLDRMIDETIAVYRHVVG